MRNLRTVLAGAATAALLSGGAMADDLVIGVMFKPNTIDPHIHFISGSHQAFHHIWETLIRQDPKHNLKPSLATSWKFLDDTTWEIKLREGVKFHDGSPFTADDVLANVERAQTPLPGNVSSSLRLLIQGGKEWKKIDDFTLQITTPEPYPQVPRDISVTHLFSDENGKDAVTADYETGKAAIGTGPYQYVEYLRGEHVKYKANPNWWRGKPKWDNVTLKIIESNPARVAALLSGSVDMIDNVPPQDVPKLENNADINFFPGAPGRLIYFRVDVSKDITPMIKANDGSELWPNPMLQYKVRKAISMAIDRETIVERVMKNMAAPASQFMAPGWDGHNSDLKPEPYDPEGAKKLLAEAGYPDGFQFTIHSSRGRYINDAQIVEAVGQMLNRVGIKTKVEIVPPETYFQRARDGQFTMPLGSWLSSTGEGSAALFHGLYPFNSVERIGMANWGWYSNRRYAEVVNKFKTEMDADKRLKMMQDAYAIATNHVGYIPLHWERGAYATRKGLKYTVRNDQMTLAEMAEKM